MSHNPATAVKLPVAAQPMRRSDAIDTLFERADAI